MSRRRAPRRTWVAIYLAPALIALAGLGGLVAGLLGDGVADLAAALGLGLPVAVVAWALWLRR